MIACLLCGVILGAPQADGDGLRIIVERGTLGNADYLQAVAALESKSARLSGELRLRFFVEGAAPLRIAVPDPPLSKTSAALWRTELVGLPMVTRLADGRERWEQTIRLVPFAMGPEIDVMPAPLQVRAGTAATEVSIEWNKSVFVHVTAEVSEVDPGALRPIAGTEELSHGPQRESTDWLLPAILAAILLMALIVIVSQRRSRPVTLEEAVLDRAKRELHVLVERANVDRRSFQELADLLRRVVAFRYNIATEKLTTEETLDAISIDVDAAIRVRSVLEAGDLAKFAQMDSTADRDRFISLVKSIRELVEQPAEKPVS